MVPIEIDEFGGKGKATKDARDCPYCGSVFLLSSSGYQHLVAIHCAICGSHGPSGNSLTMAIDLWNGGYEAKMVGAAIQSQG